MESAEQITLRLIDPREIEDALVNLHALHFTSRDSAGKRKSYVDWLLSNPCAGSIYLAAYVNGAFASFLGFMARRVVGFGREFRGALAFGAMTRPEFAGRGLYRRLAHAGWKEARQREFDFCMGYTTRRRVLDMELRMGWQRVATSPVVALPIDCQAVLRAALPQIGSLCVAGKPFTRFARALARHRSSKALRRDIVISAARAFPSEYDVLTEELQKEKRISFAKDSKTLSWLYLSPHNPFDYDIVEVWREDKLRGFAVGREMDLLGLRGYGIMDLISLEGDDEVLVPLAGRLVQSALDKNVQIVAALVSNAHPAQRALRSLGFMRSGTQFASIFMPMNDSLPMSELARAENWCNFWGNNDTV